MSYIPYVRKVSKWLRDINGSSEWVADAVKPKLTRDGQLALADKKQSERIQGLVK